VVIAAAFATLWLTLMYQMWFFKLPEELIE